MAPAGTTARRRGRAGALFVVMSMGMAVMVIMVAMLVMMIVLIMVRMLAMIMR